MMTQKELCIKPYGFLVLCVFILICVSSAKVPALQFSDKGNKFDLSSLNSFTFRQNTIRDHSLFVLNNTLGIP